MNVVLVDLNGVHMGEFVVRVETPPKLVVLRQTAPSPYTRHFVLRTGNYYDEVNPVGAFDPDKPKKV